MFDMETRIRNVDRAIEIAAQLAMYRERGDEAWAELVGYAIDNALREARELREFFHQERAA